MTAPTEVRPPSSSPAPMRSGLGGWFAFSFGAIIAIVTIATIALGDIAPQFGQGVVSDLPAGWMTVFDSDLTSATNDWQVSADCAFDRGGLFVSGSDTACTYAPSKTTDYLSQGFRLDVTLAPAAEVDKSQIPVLLAGTALFSIAQDGNFALADNATFSDSQIKDSTVNWHANGLTADAIRLEWDGPNTPLVVYTDGYKAAEIPFSMSASSDHTLRIGANTGGQALFTHISLASASGR
jgi:hypothetical protein